MKQNQLCHSFALEDLLNDDCELRQRELFEAHVAECELCQSRLSETAQETSVNTLSTLQAMCIAELR